MTYKRFEELPVWKEAVRLFEGMDDFLDSAPTRLRYAFRDQLERATLSVSNNIAEGFERGTTNELLNFIYISRGSSAEVRSMLCILEQRMWMKDFAPTITELKTIAESCSRQLRAWADSLQNSDIKGQRHLNDSVRNTNARKESALDLRKEFLSRLPDTDARKKAAIERGEI